MLVCVLVCFLERVLVVCSCCVSCVTAGVCRSAFVVRQPKRWQTDRRLRLRARVVGRVFFNLMPLTLIHGPNHQTF